MPNDWIPKKDADFDAKVTQFMNWLATPANATAAGLNAGETSALTDLMNGWNTAFEDKNTHDLAGAPLTLAKDDARAGMEAGMRPVAEQMRAKRKMGTLTDAQLSAAGIPPADTTPTASAAPTTRPVLDIDASRRFQHFYHWRDETTPGSKARPAGVKHAELRIAVTAAGAAPPADPDAYTIQASDPATPYFYEFDPADAGKTAHVLARWVSTRGEAGPWSLAASATVAG